ncbi:MAG: hypothetical protein AAFY39_13295 [Pseudomonadota bacterium]
MLILLFVMAFVLGPALFLALEQFDGRAWPLALIASSMAAVSFALRNEVSVMLGAAPGTLFASLMLIWLAWVLVLVLVVRAARRTWPGRTPRRVARSIGAMGTTVPWFGFAAAQMMAR